MMKSYPELPKPIKWHIIFWSQGLRPNEIVTVSLDPSTDFIAAIFAVLQCGACYVPIDSNYPDARLNLIIEDAAKIHIGIPSITQ
jgi:acyl-CoA synthetase (AMP-forming)/AMP-acid ligase II